ncbi:MAG TPA: hypothetical protein VLA12_11760, partial [Planctomycetaceae bacterium]|nr:hypothetical protein [Planctomycetaceae bacterium]
MMSHNSNDLSPKAGLYLHVGMPKTATTSLQKFLFAEHPQISYLGKNIHKKGPPYPNKSIQKLIKLTRGAQAFFTKEELLEIHDLSESARRERRSLVLSEELLVSGKLSNKREAARIFQRHFADCRIVLVIREPIEFVESLYFQYLKGFNLQNLCYKILKDDFGEPPYLFGINQWLDAMWDHPREPVREYLRYADNLDMYASMFGRENVSVLSFSKLKSDFDAFTTDLSRAFDIDVEITRDLLRGRHVNDRWTCAMIERLKSIQSSRPSRWKYLKWSNGRQRRKMLGLDGSKT